jgi:hypothetical protein
MSVSMTAPDSGFRELDPDDDRRGASGPSRVGGGSAANSDDSLGDRAALIVLSPVQTAKAFW